ncbi:hypothetical protein ADIMK_2716 [Marinobacterium lacunae]|uniref:Tryptophan synthase subunit beta like protein n=1 Tax=Marinobacterium lacunae TaxID=1232683 RepID=A0A081FXD7_9GAMM|nr:hypothetical protein [Marinobacterium lacunae]KEA63192.1 hypothetical protein ADIMK_2716 [Marinobacterium lacunae]MBR9884668.1 hypothetical protein [Oceanospirillales bacterium]
MLYAKFDDQGKVISLTETPASGAREVTLRDPKVLEFLSMNDSQEFDPDVFLDQSDKSTIRILEDLIDTLVSQHLIRFTDLPMPAQKKLLSRKLARNLAREEAGLSSPEGQPQENGGNILDDEEQLF